MIRFDTKKDYEKYCKEQEELVELEIENKKLKSVLDEIRELINKQLGSNTNITKYTDEMCLRHILEKLDKVKE